MALVGFSLMINWLTFSSMNDILRFRGIFNDSAAAAVTVTSAALSESSFHSDKQPNTIIVAISDFYYRHVTAVWDRRLTLLNYTNHIVLASDQEAAAYFKEQGIRYDLLDTVEDSSCVAPTANQKHRRWLFGTRWLYVLQHLQNGTNVLLTDVDNIFMYHMSMTDLEKSDYDVYHAYSTYGYPKRFFNINGFTVCGGMSWFRACNSTIALVEMMISKCTKGGTTKCGLSCDDQVVLNLLYADSAYLNMTWEPKNYRDTIYQVNQSNWKGISGVSGVTGHRIKVWDVDTSFRGTLRPQTCPHKNWVAMPAADETPKEASSNPICERLNMFTYWDELCGQVNPIGEQMRNYTVALAASDCMK